VSYCSYGVLRNPFIFHPRLWHDASRSHPSSCSIGTTGVFHRGVKRPGRESDDAPPSGVENKTECVVGLELISNPTTPAVDSRKT